MRVATLLLLALAGCATSAQLVMVNPRTGDTVGCDAPDANARSGDYLVSRACLSACQAHGFLPVPGAQSSGSPGGMPTPCTN